MLFLRSGNQIAIALSFVAIAAIGCGTDPGAAPASGGVVLTERQAVKRAIDLSQNGIYTSMLGTPIAAWGDIMTYAEAVELAGQTINPESSE